MGISVGCFTLGYSGIIATGSGSLPPPLCITYLSESQGLSLPPSSAQFVKNTGQVAGLVAPPGPGFPQSLTEGWGKKVGVRAGADRPVFCRTVCDSTMCQPPTVGGGSEVRHSQAVLVNTHPLPRRNLPVTQGGEQR